MKSTYLSNGIDSLPKMSHSYIWKNKFCLRTCRGVQTPNGKSIVH